MDTLDDAELDSLRKTVTVAGITSMIGTSLYCVRLWHRRNQDWSFSTEVLLVWLLYQNCLAFGSMWGVKFNDSPDWCQAQAWLMQFGGLACVLWMGMITYWMYLLIVKKTPDHHINSSKTMLIITTISALVASVLGMLERFGPGMLWCWIDAEYKTERYAFYFSPLIFTWVENISCLILIKTEMIRAATGNSRAVISSHDTSRSLIKAKDESSKVYGKLSRSEKLVFFQLASYVCIFLVSFGGGWMNIVAGYIHGSISFFAYLQGLLLPLSGALFCIAHSGTWLELYNRLFHGNNYIYEDVILQWTKGDDKNFLKIFKPDLLTKSKLEAFDGVEHTKSTTPYWDRRLRILQHEDEVMSLPNSLALDVSSIMLKHAVVDNVLDSVQEINAPFFVPECAANLSIFTSTYNMGGVPVDSYFSGTHSKSTANENQGKLDANGKAIKRKKKNPAGNIDAWIPRGHDVYAISVQEVDDVPALARLLRVRLNGDMDSSTNVSKNGKNGNTEYIDDDIESLQTAQEKSLGEESKSSYYSYHTSVSSDDGLTGYKGSIAILLFFRKHHVDKGYINPCYHSKNGAKSQKFGAAAIPVQIFDTSIVFVAAHLPSDERIVSRLELRNETAYNILKGLTMTPEENPFDLHQQHHHCFFIGDLNYKIVKPFENIPYKITDDELQLMTKDEQERYEMLCSENERDPNATLNAVIKASLTETKVLNDADIVVNSTDGSNDMSPLYPETVGNKKNVDDLIRWLDLRLDSLQVHSNQEFLQKLLSMLPTEVEYDYVYREHSNNGNSIIKYGVETLFEDTRISTSVSRTSTADTSPNPLLHAISTEVLSSKYFDEHLLITKARFHALEEWKKVSAVREELIHSRRNGEAFCGFHEGFGIVGEVNMEKITNKENFPHSHDILGTGFPTFPPTFSRKEWKNELKAGVSYKNGDNTASVSKRLRTKLSLLESCDFTNAYSAAKLYKCFGLISAYHSNFNDRKVDEYGDKTDSLWNERTHDEDIALENNINRIMNLNSPLPFIELAHFKHPSFTDRILYSSTDDRVGRIHVTAYDCCEYLQLSDHRPVSMVAHLLVNERVAFRKFYSEPAENPMSHIYNTETSHKERNSTINLDGAVTITNTDNIYYIFELQVVNLHVLLPDIEFSTEPSAVGLPIDASLPSYLRRPFPDIRAGSTESTVKSSTTASAKKCEKRVDSIDVCFPLSSCDPLLTERVQSERARGFFSSGLGGTKSDGRFGDKDERLLHDLVSIGEYYSKEYDSYKHGRNSSDSTFKGSYDMMTNDNFLRSPATTFKFTPEGELVHNDDEEEQESPTTNANAQKRPSVPAAVHVCANFKVQACAIPALGAHALLRFRNATIAHGSCVVNLTDLIDIKQSISYSNQNMPGHDFAKRKTLQNIPVVEGGKLVGVARGDFSLNLLAVVEHP